MVSAFLNSVKIPEFRRRILFTLAVIVIVRLGAAITTPGVNQAVIQEWFRTSLTENQGGNVAALFNLFSGGALENCAIFSLGIMPYISASIMMQLLTAVIPKLGRLAKEDGGRQKIMQFTRYATVVLCLVQGYLLGGLVSAPRVVSNDVAGNHRYDSEVRDSTGGGSGHDLPNCHGVFSDYGDAFSDVAWRSNHGAGHRKRHFTYYYNRHRGASARSPGAGVEDFCAVGRDRNQPG